MDDATDRIPFNLDQLLPVNPSADKLDEDGHQNEKA
jgi:hypothetical protein